MLKVSKETDGEKQNKEDKEFNKIYDQQLNKWVERESLYKAGMLGDYGMIMGKYVTSGLKAKIKTQLTLHRRLGTSPLYYYRQLWR